MPLLATIPTGWPSMWAKAQTRVRPYFSLNSRKRAAVDDPAQDLAHVPGGARADRDDVEDLLGVACRRPRLDPLPGRRRGRRQGGDDFAQDLERLGVVFGEVVGDAGLAGVDVAAAELLRGHLLPGRRLHQRRAAEEDRPLVADDHGLVAHRRHVGAAGRAGAHHRRQLRDLPRRHRRLVEEDAAEVVAVGEDFVLQRQEGAAGVDQVDAGQAVLQGDLLGAEVLLHRHRVVGAAFDRGVVGDDDAAAAADGADPGDDPGPRRRVVVHPVRGERRELEEGRVGVAERLDPFARGQLAAAAVALDRLRRRRRRGPAPARRSARRSAPGASRACRREPHQLIRPADGKLMQFGGRWSSRGCP